MSISCTKWTFGIDAYLLKSGSRKSPHSSGKIIVSIISLPPSLSMSFKSFICLLGFLWWYKRPILKTISNVVVLSALKTTTFDIVFSMGLLYHQRNPSKHINDLKDMLKEGGKLIIETIILPDECGLFLEPDLSRYASMPNVHFVHEMDIWHRCIST